MGWTDPFALMALEDKNNSTGDFEISSLICQQTVSASYSGAAIVSADNKLKIEGVVGTGDKFMQGEVGSQYLPLAVRRAVERLYEAARLVLGPVRFEWVYDEEGQLAWLVQLHKGATSSTDRFLVPGSPAHWIPFKTDEGLEALRNLVENMSGETGLMLEGNVGVTSHFADILRKAGIAARFRK
jgi:hypothetical protein